MRLRGTTSSTWIGVGIAVVALMALAQGHPLRAIALFVIGLNVVVLLRARHPRYVLFPMLTVALAIAVPMIFVTTLDLYLHHRYDATGGYNIWGYRGPVVGAKKPDERRIAVLGGSVAFGYGVRSDETIPFYLENTLNETRTVDDVSVVNLAWNSEGAYSFRFTLEDYDDLEPDAVILYSGYNDVALNTQVFRRQSAVFRTTGYLPILPVVPVTAWLHIRDLSETRTGQVVFNPNLADRTAAGAADLARGIQRALERQLSTVAREHSADPDGRSAGCEGRWNHYCNSIHAAIEYALGRNRHVIVVTEPYVGGGGRGADMHISQQSAMRGMLTETFPGEPRLHYVNMGRAVDLTDSTLCYDGVHLTAAGNAQVATTLAPQIEDILSEMKAPALTDSLPMPLGRVSDEVADGVKAATLARQATDDLLLGHLPEALKTAKEALQLDRGAASLWAGALAHAFAGRLPEAETLAAEFERLTPSDLFTVKLWAPVLRGAIELRRRNPEGALQILEPTIVYERGTYWSRYLRALCYLEMDSAYEAEPELRQIIDQPGIDTMSAIYVAAQAQLARARERM